MSITLVLALLCTNLLPPTFDAGRDSSVRIATRYGPGDRIPEAAQFFAPVQTGPGVHTASYTMGTGSFQGVGRPGRGADHPHLALSLK